MTGNLDDKILFFKYFSVGNNKIEKNKFFNCNSVLFYRFEKEIQYKIFNSIKNDCRSKA